MQATAIYMFNFLGVGVFLFIDCLLEAHLCKIVGFPDGSDGKESACNVGDLGWIPGSDPWVGSLGREDPLEEEMATHSNILA